MSRPTRATTVTRRVVRRESEIRPPARPPEQNLVVILDLDTVYRLPWAGFEVYPYRVYTLWWRAENGDPWQPCITHVMCRKYPGSCIPVQLHYQDPGHPWSRCPTWLVEQIREHQPTPEDLDIREDDAR